ncbi:MAG: chromosome segregation protein SMC [Thermoanaerobaculia bacterium]
MLRLDRVEISGFKSFYEKVDLSFPGEVTAVVGPNGCGKSNICDAVAWALGEQSARILRGERMDDVIFNGSARRRPVGMAEVVLTLSPRGGNGNGNGNGNGDSPSEPLRIGRRVYREGHGEYFLNDKQVRLKDIQDRLSGTGLGVRAYSVIEQGRMDQVLSTKPQDRRRLIEEAAGVTRYRLKKRLAETKLEETRGNLLRLSDIISEIERNCASLKRQASRAARYKEQSEALRERRGALARVRHERLRRGREEAQRNLVGRRAEEAEAAAALARAEAGLVAARLAATEAAEAHNRLREEVAALDAEIGRDDTLLEATRRAAADLAARREGLERDAAEAAAQYQRTGGELAELEERLRSAVAEARARSAAREDADRRATAAALEFARLEAELESLRAEALSATSDRVAAANGRHAMEVEASRSEASLARLLGELGRLDRDLAQREEEVAGAEGQRDRLAARAGDARRRLEEAETDAAGFEAAIRAAEARGDEARDALGRFVHRLAALAELARREEDHAEESRRALASVGGPDRGALSERLRPLPGWEEAVDQLLGEDLRALFAGGETVSRLAAHAPAAGVRLVRTDWSGTPARTPVGGALGGWEVALADYASLSPAEQAALPPVTFVENLPLALALSVRHPAALFATPRGEAVRGSLVRLAHVQPAASGVFAMARERRALEGRGEEARETLAQCEQEIERLRDARRQREEAYAQAREEAHREESSLSSIHARVEERRIELDRTRRERATLAAELEALGEQAAAIQRSRDALGADERLHAAREESARQRVDALAARLPELRSLAMSAAEELAHRRTEAEVAAERRRSLEQAREKLLEARGAVEHRTAEAAEQRRQLAARAEEIAREESDARARRFANLRQHEESAARLEVTGPAAADATERVEAAETATRERRAALDTVREGRFGSEMAETRLQADLDHLVAQAREEFGVSPSELPAPAEDTDEALARLESEAAELAASIERIGPVNVLAYEEHREEAARLSFLTTQRDDLLRSIAELQESIRKINATSSQRFAEAFAAINENFKEMFARLFQGGTAEMRLLDENDLLESGVEISAQPPGKRNQSILLLSGGEKALTAIALLMAIFRYKPSPFCILDEVDAPLDEANIDRFTRLLRDMTEETQFIAITHNKRTMETADVMYGVTMEEPGCSKIVSVKFD